MSETHPNLMASDVVVLLPEDPALAAIAERGRENFLEVVAAHPTSSLCWALMAETCLVESDRYLLNVMRYIELNPVRAGMVQDPGQYRWSSYRHNGLGQPDPRITPHPLYLAIDRNDADRQSAYRALFRSDSYRDR